jgi:hypothetical protein
MEWIVRYDAWCEARVTALVKWLEEWFSISQKQTERGLMILYVFLIFYILNILVVWKGLYLLFCFVVGSVLFAMWIMQSRPMELRGGDRPYKAVSRVSVQILFGMLICIILLKLSHGWHSWKYAAGQVVYLIFFYMIGINSNGERGRRRKLALAKLKKCLA